MDARTKAKVQFIDWAKRRFPRVHAEAIRRSVPKTVRNSGLGEAAPTDAAPSATASVLDNVVNTIGKLGTAYAQYKGQSQIIDMNVQRAKAGLPPIDAGDIAPQANVGIASSTRTLMYVGIAAIFAIGAMAALRRR